MNLLLVAILLGKPSSLRQQSFNKLYLHEGYNVQYLLKLF